MSEEIKTEIEAEIGEEVEKAEGTTPANEKKVNLVYDTIHAMIKSKPNVNKEGYITLSEKLGTTRQTLHHLIKNQTISAMRLAEIARACGYDMVFVPTMGRGLMSVRSSLTERAACENCPATRYMKESPAEISASILALSDMLAAFAAEYDVEAAKLTASIMQGAMIAESANIE